MCKTIGFYLQSVMDYSLVSRLYIQIGFVFLFAGVGFLGAVDAVGRVEAGAEHFLLALAVATTHGLDDVIEA